MFFYFNSFSQTIDTINISNYPTQIRFKHYKNEIDVQIKSTSIDTTNKIIKKTIQGFRIQVASTSEFDEISDLKNRISLVYTGDIYIRHDAPLFKIRIGNFLRKSEGEELLRILKDSGFTSAWMVPDQVNILK